jgi:hypothetical protein
MQGKRTASPFPRSRAAITDLVSVSYGYDLMRSSGSWSSADCVKIDNLSMLEHTGTLMPDRHFGPTRLVRAAALSMPDRDLYLKLETELPTGSFKVRGPSILCL